ncbi:filamentous haemagglutinin family protein [Variovorax sp. J2P1-31]|uniref:filamentous haemagglutinin family protein n=1 Tax=Variovorax sp. J2P1-31 TaxID=3053497 RepID=UPI0025757FC3|nr:filamentous haemagglutinin family protein [Variovorax sp. J2P1-31]MDM0148335.1 filamentous hemagglutinin family protein [Variovorax sp. J2P1-31]
MDTRIHHPAGAATSSHSQARSALRLTPLVQALMLALAAGGMVGSAHAQRALGAAWLAQKNVIQGTAQATGRLPNGQPVSSLTNPTQQRDNAQMQRSLDNLNLAARGIAAQQAAQEAARLAALNATATVPDGLVDGGLKVDTNSLTAGWLNAKAPVQSVAGGRTVVGIEQTDEKAILNWESSNVGRNTTVKFDQSKGRNAKDGTNGWIALNRINDPGGKPSQIAGQIQAEGSVYLVNRNGIVFHGSSQVNTRSLVASSLSLSDKQFKLGINNQQSFPDAYEGQGDAFGIPQFGDFTAVRPDINLGFEPGRNGAPDKLGGVDRFVPGALPGAVQVLAGARLEAASGGKVMLFAPKVSNAGRISAPDGQVILAAGENVYLNESRATDRDPLRGLDVAVSAAQGWAFAWTHLYNALTTGTSPYNPAFTEALKAVVLKEMAERASSVGYDVTNSGIVQAERGNITMQAMDVHQNGVALATTALNNRNGSVLLRAWGLGTHAWQNSDTNDVLLNWAAGTLTLGEGSVTRVGFDAGDTSEIETTALATRYQPGWISLYGQLIDFRPQAGVIAPAGTVKVESAVNPLNIQLGYFRPSHLGDASRIYLDRDAYVSVAGVQGARVDMARNFIEAELRINELRDSPLQLDAWLRGKKLIVDRRANGVFTDGPMAGVEWVKNAAGAYIPGAWVGTPLADVAGWVGVGKTDLAELSTDAGTITLRAGGAFISREGSLLDVSGGSVRYADGLNTATKLIGADGRVYSADKAMPDMAFTGIAGQYVESHSRWGVSTAWQSPVIGRHMLESGYTEGRAAGTVKIFAGSGMVLEGGYAGDVVVGERQQKQAAKKAGGTLAFGNGSVEERPWSLGELVIGRDPHRLAADFGAKSPLGEDFVAPPLPGRVDKLSYIRDDELSASGMGTIEFHLRRDFTLQAGAVLDLAPGASVLVNEFENSTNTVTIDGTVRAAGGDIRITAARGTLRLGEGGRLDTGGQWINSWRDGVQPRHWAIHGGTVMLDAEKLDIATQAVIDVSGGGRVDAGKKGLPALRVGNAGTVGLTGLAAGADLGALDLRALAAGSAGTLALTTAASVQLGGSAAAPDVLWLPGDLYGARGFGVVSVNSLGDIRVPDDAQVTQLPHSLALDGFDYRHLASGTRLAEAVPVAVLAPEQRFARRPVQLALGGTGDITVGSGAVVRSDAGGTLRLKTEAGATTVHGTLEAPAGRIELEGRQVALSTGAQLLARGVPLLHADATGVQVGQVLDGGTVAIGKGPSLLTLEEGALVDVSGATGRIDGVRSGNRFGGSAAPMQTLDSHGGSILISGTGLIASTLKAEAGGPGARGGRLQLMLAAPTSALGSPLEQLAQNLVDPDCFGLPGDGVCGNWTGGLDYDWAPGLRSWGYDIDRPMVIPTALLAHLQDTQEIVLSDRATQPGRTPALDGSAFGLTPEVLDLFRDNLFYADLLRDALATPGQRHALTVRPGSIARGGFADLALTGNVRLDQVDLSLGRSIAITGPIVGHEGTSSRLRAPQLVLSALSDGVAAAAPAGAAAAGQLTLAGRLVDIRRDTQGGDAGMHIGGFARTVIEGDEIRFAGELPTQIQDGSRFDIRLAVDGALVLRAGQVYPSTGMSGVVQAGDAITVERLGDARSAPLSAGGTLRLEAPVITQNGVLRAPFGQIELVAGRQLTLGDGSLSSVSGAGLDVPYGYLVNNEHWHDPRKAADGSTAGGSMTAPPEKRITLKAPEVNLAKGAVLDITGGGDLHAAEFVPGPGGSHDVLNVPGMYAIVPGYDSAAPVNGVPAGARVWLAGGPGLAAGWYTLLPARYALLPGAFAVQGNGRDWRGVATGAARLPDGSFVVQGRRGDSLGGTQDEQASGWRVLPGATVRKYTEYNEAFANEFFSSEAFKLTQYRLTGQNVVTPRLARDGGAVLFEATQTLLLDGTLRSQPDAGGRGGLVDIAGQKIAIVGAGQDAGDLRRDGYLVIDAASLSGFGAGSLLVGGKRSGDALGLRLDVTASDIVVRNDAGSALYGPEIILAASEQVRVDAGSRLAVKGRATSGGGDLIVTPHTAAVYTDPDGRLDDNGDGVIDARDAKDDVLTAPARDHGALLRLSSGEAARVVRQNVDIGEGGLVRIGAGAVIDGGAALLIDATRSTELAGSAQIRATDLSVAAGRIGFGGGSGGMVLDAGSLAQLSDSTRLTLRSYSSFDFYRSLDLGAAGLASLTFDGAAFVAAGAGDITVQGDRVTLANSGGTAAPMPAGGSGSLRIDARELVLGQGQKTFAGFAAVSLGGSERIVGEGKGGIDSGASALTLRTPLLTGRGGAVQSIATQGELALLAQAEPGTAPADAQASLGASLSLAGRNVRVASRAQALGGSIDITANGGSVVVAEGAVLDVGGFAKQFFDVAEYADAGSIRIGAIGGDIRLQGGSRLNLAAHPDGGNAGRLSLAASGGGTVRLDGEIAAQAGADGGKAGAFSLDIAALPDFAAFSQRLNDSGFNRSRQFRVREGDVRLDGSTTVEDFALVADQGRVDITGRIDARSAYGGAIRIVGGDGLTMQAGAQLLAGTTGELGSGRVTLEATGGVLALRGGRIDVAGADGGVVRLRALRNAANDDIAVTQLAVDLVGARSAVLEGTASYTADTVEAVKAVAVAEAHAFAARAAAIQARLGSGMQVMAGIEIQSPGDLTLGSDWNLHQDFAGAHEGTLSLRAAGNLVLHGHLSDGFDAADRTGVLQDAASWNLRLVAGADLASADRLALQPLAGLAAGQGSITIGTANTAAAGEPDNGAGKLLRTGTGDIEVRAGRDLTLAHRDSVIYTAGRKDLSRWDDFTTARADARYGTAGGNLDLNAQGNITAAPSDQRYTQWLNRQGNLSPGFFFGEYNDGTFGEIDGVYGPIPHAPEQSSWWVNHGEFRQGVGVFGGGNVRVRAGGDVVDLGVSLTTTARVRGGLSVGAPMTMEMRNGGALTVDAAGALRGGQYYVARGAGEISAGETATGRSVDVRRHDGGSSTVSATYALAPVLALGDATMTLRTAGDLRLQTVLDPLLVRYGEGYRPTGLVLDYGAYMSGYTARTALRLLSTGGDVTLVNQGEYVFRDVDLYNNNTADNNLAGKGANRYPALVQATAMNGSLALEGAMYLMPAARSDLRLLAQQDVVLRNGPNAGTPEQPFTEIVMARATPAMMPSAFVPLGGDGALHQVNLNALLRNDMGLSYTGATQELYYQGLRNPDPLPLAGDHEPSRVYAAKGSILGLDMTASEQTWARAGTDIRGIRLSARNVHAQDSTLLEAGNDILSMRSVRNASAGAGLITVEGAGALVLSAGRDVYADDLQIQTLGNRRYDSNNRPVPLTQVNGLPDNGASITVMAGMNAAAGYGAFAAAYLDPTKVAAMPAYLTTRGADGTLLPSYLSDRIETRLGGLQKTVRRGLVSYMHDMTGETLAPLEAWARFNTLPALAQQQFIRQIYLLELREAGRDQNEPGTGGLPRNGGYNRGYEAIKTLFPGTGWKGDVAANQLMLRTMAGGDINVLTPGGGLQVAALGATVPEGYGLVTLASGHIDIFANDDVTVNRSRILSFVPEATQQGSDQIIWSTVGDIDAGRGSKTVRVPSAPEVLTDLNGNTTVREKSDMSGSGIGTVGDGDVDLVAPLGTVNAGDAGLRVAGNLNIAALQVLNADNIQVKGESKGIPVIAAVNIGALTNASAATAQATAAAQEVLQRERAAARQALPSVFTVRVLGFGGEAPEGAPRSPAPAARGGHAGAPGQALEVLGQMDLPAAQLSQLSATEQRNLRR